jgi:hypothetical protein
VLFITYFELNPDLDPSEIAEITQKLISKGVYPPKGTKILSWYVSTGDYWGIMVSENESAEAAAIGTNAFRVVKPGIFKCVKSTLAMKAEDLIPVAMKIGKQIKG